MTPRGAIVMRSGARCSEHTCKNERFSRAAHADPDRQRILERARVDRLAGKGRAMFAGPVHFCAARIFRSRSSFSTKSEYKYCQGAFRTAVPSITQQRIRRHFSQDSLVSNRGLHLVDLSSLP